MLPEPKGRIRRKITRANLISAPIELWVSVCATSYTLNERQRWILAQIQNGTRRTTRDIAHHFRHEFNRSTIGRDLKTLRERGLIVTHADGHYVARGLAKHRSGAGTVQYRKSAELGSASRQTVRQGFLRLVVISSSRDQSPDLDPIRVFVVLLQSRHQRSFYRFQ